MLNWLLPKRIWRNFHFDKPPEYHLIIRGPGADLHVITPDVHEYLLLLASAGGSHVSAQS